MSSALREQQKLKGLRSKLVIAEEELEALKSDVKLKQQEFDRKRKLVDSLKEEIATYKDPSNIQITEHAIVRYFERVKGFNMDEIKEEIITEYLKDLINKMGGSGKYPNAGDATYKIVMKNNVIVTIED